MFGGSSSGRYLGGTWELLLPVSAEVATYGTGCGSPPLGFVPLNRPVLGTTASALMSLPPTPIGAASVGFSNTSYNGVPLPLELSFLGLPGCWQLQSQEALALPVTVGPANASLRFDLAIPNDPVWLALDLYVQGFCLAPGANPSNIIVSNGVAWTIGSY